MRLYFPYALSFLALSSFWAMNGCVDSDDPFCKDPDSECSRDPGDWEPDCDKKTGEYEKCADGLYIRCFIDTDSGEYRWLTEGCQCANEKACVKSEGGEKTAE